MKEQFYLFIDIYLKVFFFQLYRIPESRFKVRSQMIKEMSVIVRRSKELWVPAMTHKPFSLLLFAHLQTTIFSDFLTMFPRTIRGGRKDDDR